MPINEMTEDEFIGRYETSSAFECDGHSPEYDVYREALDLTEVAWISEDGVYGVHVVIDSDFSPETSLLSTAGEVIGFYAGGEVWIDPAHRGRGLSTPLILALVERHEGPVHDNGQITAFSPSGLAAHRRAYREVAKLGFAPRFGA